MRAVEAVPKGLEACMARETLEKRRREYAYEDEQGENPGMRLLREMLEVAVITLLLFVVVRGVMQNFRVDGPSMEPTLQNHEYIIVNKLQYVVSSPQRGDIIVFKWPEDTSQDFVKRVIGIPGDTVTVSASGQVTVDGVNLNEPYVNDLTNPYRPRTWTLGPNQYFVMGDNRGDSSDSRAWGPVPRSDIIGRADMVYWPFNDAHFLSDWPSVFAAVRQ